MQRGTIEILRDDKSPQVSPNTRLVAAARTCGFPYGAEKNFIDAFEEMPGGETRRTVTWIMNGDVTMPFIWATEDEHGSLEAHKEDLTFKEFQARYTDLEWVKKNPDHPISYLRGAHWHHVRMLKTIHELPQHNVIRRGKRSVAIPTDATDEEKAMALKFIGG